jgi:trans-aconitate 2-methyltransferase
MDWSPDLYLAFERERTRPAADLLDAVPNADARHVVDLGCGPGNSTELLVARFPNARVVGIDTSPAMLAEARRRLPGAAFIQSDVATWTPAEAPDVIFANAVLQWLPDHASLLPRLAALLAPGGSLAVQMPDNLDEPTHRAMREIGADPRWRDRMAAAFARGGIGSPAEHWTLLRPHCRRVDVWRTVYHHVVAGPAGVVEWLSGTGLRPYLAPLSEDERDAFRARLEARIAEAYPVTAAGELLLPFPRSFIVATR